ncbi:hypothetical protein TSUD_204130 [Trifolium subterraneum]|uniref:Uncharacterized protein n=1 Tax=Trifolium subterraneum TaxID=3900 RepID=A0A2Z6LHS3_TRISU|nr:hypothetical protein TSUD_204130 [Trifolium subterraneum]
MNEKWVWNIVNKVPVTWHDRGWNAFQTARQAKPVPMLLLVVYSTNNSHSLYFHHIYRTSSVESLFGI